MTTSIFVKKMHHTVYIHFHNTRIKTCVHQLSELFLEIKEQCPSLFEYWIEFEMNMFPIDALGNYRRHQLRFETCTLHCSDQEIILLLSKVSAEHPSFLSAVSPVGKPFTYGGPMITI